MKSIEERANKIGGVHPDWSSVECMRRGYIEGAEEEHKLLTEWNNPKDKMPTDHVPVEIKYNRGGHISYAVAYMCQRYEFDLDTKIWMIDCTFHIIDPCKVIGWREIHE